MAKARAMVDIIAAKAGAHELLEEIGFFIRAFCRAKTCQGAGTILLTNVSQSACGEIERFVPTGFAEMREWIGWIHHIIGALFFSG